MCASESGLGSPVLETHLPLPLLGRGKVRDLYDAGGDFLLLVASDRVSAFDVVLPQPIPHKGEVLTLLTAWWLARLQSVVDHHLVAVRPEEIEEMVPRLAGTRRLWARRAMLVKRTEPLPVECVVRGYLAGSAWKEYRERGTLAGEPLPPGLQESQRLEPPLFSPATKAQGGEHDLNIPFREVVARLGEETATRLRELSLLLYRHGEATARERGIVLADTKFEFGRLKDGRLLLIDEVMTPDSSRYWPLESYRVGTHPPSLDKQPIRDWLEALPHWNKKPPAPDLPPEVVRASSERYLEIFRRLVGVELADYEPPAFLA